jgi:membrane-associated phospholipid phosphatase
MNKRVCSFLTLFFLLLIQVPLTAQSLDIRLLRSINSPESLRSDNFFQFVSDSHVYVVFGVPAGLAASALIRKDDNMLRNAGVIFSATVVNLGITAALKYSIRRDRPFITYPDIMKKSAAGSPSFPSGHTSAAFATATSLSMAYPKWYIVVPSYTWAGTVGYSRMHLGVHYPSDVLIGALVGSGSAWLTHEVNRKLNRKRQ